jgi:hypothetical protein
MKQQQLYDLQQQNARQQQQMQQQQQDHASGDDVLPWQGIGAASLFVDHWKAACARS